MRELVRDAIKLIADEAKRKGLILELREEEGSYIVRGDKTKFEEHVLRNLLENALHYTPHGHIHVMLSHGNGKVRLAVQDSGVGITPDDMQKLFTKGGKGKDSSTINKDSTGYGLHVAKSVVEAHDGMIWAESPGKDKGSTFYVELSAKQ